MERPLYEALDELRAARDDLQRSSYQTFDGIFARYVALLTPDSPIGEVLETILPEVDFDPFWDAATSTMGGMVGSGKLAFPGDKRQRVAMQRALLLRMSIGKPDVHHVTYFFFHSGSSPIGHRHDFVSQVIDPFQRDLANILNPFLQEEKAAVQPVIRSQMLPQDQPRPFVDPDRIARFRSLDNEVPFDLSKLIRLSEELNLANGNRAWHSVAFLVRTVMNHIAPALGHPTFAQVAANATPKHFKVAAQALEVFGRTVADFHLHETMNDQLSLPTNTQVNMSQQLDVVLSEVERALAKLAQTKGAGP